MVSIRADNLSLTYRIRRSRRLSGPAAPTPHGGVIVGEGRSQHIRALDGLDFSLESGDRLGLVGGNGAGKTTLLKVLYGIFKPTSGAVDVSGRTDALFNINLGFRREATGRRNIILRGLINGWSDEEVEQRMDEIVEFSELGDFIDMPMKTYSAGMSARLAFSVATCLEPEILLMDEWIGAGDPEFQMKARNRMSDMAERAGIIVLASHNHQLLRRICNKVMKLDHGRMVHFGPAEDYFAQEGATK